MSAVAQVDVFSLAAAVTALLLAAALLCAYAINRRLNTFVWWAGSFALLALWLATMTLRLEAPAVWLKWLSWGSFLAAACLVTHGLYRAGAMRTYPVLRMLICGALLVAIAITLTLLNARPSYWMLIGPVPTLVFMAWSSVTAFRARAAGYGWALLAGICAVTLVSLLHPAGLARALGPPPPPGALRGSFGTGSDPVPAINLDVQPAPRGVLDLTPPPGPRPPVEQPLALTLLTIVALLGLAVALVLRDMLTELDRMRRRSSIDAMTGLLNRATFEETATALLRETDTRSACVIMFDIDHFKRINDTAGHAAGDRVIALLGQFLREMTSLHCLAGRVGGEEFAVILEGGDLGAARQFADAVRARLSASDFGDDIGWGVTVSAGIARRLAGESLLGLTARADKALYAAKETGRDKVVVAPDAEQESQWQGRPVTLAARA